MTQHFTLTPATDRNVTARITAAYTAAGIAAPTTFVPVLKRYMAQQPDAQQVAATLAHDAYHADPDTDPAEWWARARQQMIDAQASDALRAALAQSLTTEERSSGTRQITRALTDLHPWADRQAQALVKAAKALPAGPGALDPETVLAHDAGKALTSARNALSALALLASLGDPARHVGTLRDLARVLPLIDPSNPAEEKVTNLGRTVNGTKLDTTHALRRLAQDVRTSPDLALVGVARGDYPGVNLSPADTLAAIGERAKTAAAAFTRKTVDEATANHLVAMH
ncbi:hypothetical protein [Brachybacterium paraconglomeratum]|uniref:hypothetical protein n=1 Tax=Brachybacterium paraconglomeratum TaxID=173362 RepID=UPI00223AA0DC|nr:hypothetical protein [Brachybacterium paraconglomeratum]MCT1437167.1 hypothetical protein [Brachybacterium paraconglomeratum]